MCGIGLERGVAAVHAPVSLARCPQLRSLATRECIGRRPLTVVMISGFVPRPRASAVVERLADHGVRGASLRRPNRRVELTITKKEGTR